MHPLTPLAQNTDVCNDETRYQTDFQDVEAVVTTKANLNMAIVEADGKYHTWMEGRSGILRTEPKTSFGLSKAAYLQLQEKDRLHMRSTDIHFILEPHLQNNDNFET